MSNPGKSDFPDGGDRAWSRHEAEPSWADESLPLEVRRQLLDRDLHRIIQRKHAQAGGHAGEAPQRDAPDHPGAGNAAGGCPDRGG